MVRYAAITESGQRSPVFTDREKVDEWARDKCAEGFVVKVYSQRAGGNNQYAKREFVDSSLVGLWEPLTEEEKLVIHSRENSGRVQRTAS